MPAGSIHDLHIFVFTLAAIHIAYTVIIIAIGTWVVGRWKKWEARADEKEKMVAEGGARITHEITFVRKRAASKWFKYPVVAYVAAFFKQFLRTVTETDYITVRGGFIKSHLAENPGFNFHKYIQRSFQDDFKHVVGISPGLWIYAIFWLLVNVNDWEANLIVSLIPLLLVLAIGTKMQHILTQMANEIQEQHAVVLGMPLVKPNDGHFWFGRPRFILKCFHFIVFENALETAFSVWAVFTFPTHTCLHRSQSSLILHVAIGVFIQVLCGFVALPVYALVSQMGSRLKRTIFSEDVNSAMSRWQVRAKKTSNDPPSIAKLGSGEGHSLHQREVEMVADDHQVINPRSQS